MPRQFRKSVCLSPICDPANPCADGDYRYRGGPQGNPPSVASLFAESNTSWIRLWADWYDIQRGGPDTIDSERLYALDENIAKARREIIVEREGKRLGGVLLATRSYPLWANGTARLVRNQEEADSRLVNEDDPCVVALARDRPFLTDEMNELPVRDLRFRFPLARPAGQNAEVCLGGSAVSYDFDVGDGSDWYYWIKFLATRYNPTRPQPTLHGDDPYAQLGLEPPQDREAAVIDCLEFVNEPNGPEGWPQLDADDAMIAPIVVAQMFKTARKIRMRDLSGADGPLMAGPAVSTSSGRAATPRAPGSRVTPSPTSSSHG